MSLRKLNSEQVRIIGEIEAGQVATPKNKEEFSKWLKDFALAYDYKSLEANPLELCRLCYLRVAEQRGDELGFVYRSTPMQIVKKRKYFSDLRGSASNRGVDARKLVEQSLIDVGLILRVGNQVRVTAAGKQYLEKVKQSDQY